jgi:hypothetical protein
MIDSFLTNFSISMWNGKRESADALYYEFMLDAHRRNRSVGSLRPLSRRCPKA